MRNKADLDELSMDNFTNEAVNTTYEVSTANSQGQASSSSYVDDVMFSFFVREVTLLENRGHQGIRRNRNRDVPRIIVPVETTANALVVQDGIGGYDWSFQAEEGATDFSLMAHLSSVHQFSSSNSRFGTTKYVRPSAPITNRQAENLRKCQSPRVDKRNWNGLMTQKLGDVLTKSGNVLVNIAKQSSSRAVVSNSIVRYVNTAATRPTMNDVKETNAAVGYGENAIKSSTCWIWRQTGNVIDHTSKDSGSYMFKRFDYVDLQGRFNGCSRHMTRNKSFLTLMVDLLHLEEVPKEVKLLEKVKLGLGN
ncbi:hypothetical protein Tco_1221925 [Tanacetum coccineum]